jgi:GT2 family glycosyltransferase
MTEQPHNQGSSDPYPKLGIIILNWNNWQDTLDCVEALGDCSYTNKEIWIVDNASEDESTTKLGEIDDIHLMCLDKNYGFAVGNNVGIRAALDQACDFVLLLNNDTDLPRDFIQPLLEPFRKDPQASVCSPKILYSQPAGTIWYAGGKFRNPRIIGEMVGMGSPDQDQYNQLCQTDFAVGTCMLIKRELFERIGLLDERFFFYHEDVDFCYRAKQAGYTIWYQPKSTIIHRVSSSTKKQPSMRVFLYQRARVVFLCKHIRGIKTPIVLILEIIRLFRVIINGMMHLQMDLPMSYLKGLAAGLKDSRGFYNKQKIS